MYQEFNDLLQKLKRCDRNTRCFVIKEMADAVQYATKANLQELLDLTYTCNDKELQIKLFSIFSIYLLNNNTNVHLFVKFNPIYDTLYEIISKNIPRKITVALNFLTLLLQSNCIENTSMKSSLYVHAQNMIRISGCLATMADLFLSSMMYQETWQALCRCLAETCSNCEQNQNYCTHLIPKCVKNCSQRNVETFPVLQSLIYNNKRNVQLFLECDGMFLFRRELLRYESSIQLLNTVIETSTEAAIFAQKDGIIKRVHDLLRLYGPYTVTGQWATVILYHADINIKDTDCNKETDNIQMFNNSQTATNFKDQMSCDGSDTIFLRNAIKEIVQWDAKEQNMCKSILNSNNISNLPKENNFCMPTKHMDQINLQFNKFNKKLSRKPAFGTTVNPVDELSFSFLSKHFSGINNDVFINKVNKDNEFFKNATKIGTKFENETAVSDSHFDINKSIIRHDGEMSMLDLKEFKPNIVSTPKRDYYKKSKIKNYMQNISLNKGNRNIINKNAISKMSVDKKILKQRSFKAKVFDAINNSCTALMNSVTSIFKPKNMKKMDNLNIKLNSDTEACSYSFTEYMRKRDAIAANHTNTVYSEENFTIKTDSCKTCNNTDELKNKMVNDELLKETVKKLKKGINMYGCDFKKISKVMWPQEDYMTPAILYNLYRKIIMK